MVIKVKEKCEKTKNVRNNDKTKKYILRGERNTSYYERNLSKSKEIQQNNKNFIGMYHVSEFLMVKVSVKVFKNIIFQ